MPNLAKNINEMNLSEYVIESFDRFCDLTEGRLLSLNKLMKPIKPIKYKGASIYPNVVKDLAFVMDKNTTSLEIETIIKNPDLVK